MIWERFPKFVIGFVVASAVFSFALSPELVAGTRSALGEIRTWWFALAFVCIGLETRFIELATYEQGRPALAFLGAQGINVIWTLLLAWLLFGGVIVAQPIDQLTGHHLPCGLLFPQPSAAKARCDAAGLIACGVCFGARRYLSPITAIAEISSIMPTAGRLCTVMVVLAGKLPSGKNSLRIGISGSIKRGSVR